MQEELVTQSGIKFTLKPATGRYAFKALYLAKLVLPADETDGSTFLDKLASLKEEEINQIDTFLKIVMPIYSELPIENLIIKDELDLDVTTCLQAITILAGLKSTNPTIKEKKS